MIDAHISVDFVCTVRCTKNWLHAFLVSMVRVEFMVLPPIVYVGFGGVVCKWG